MDVKEPACDGLSVPRTPEGREGTYLEEITLASEGGNQKIHTSDEELAYACYAIVSKQSRSRSTAIRSTASSTRGLRPPTPRGSRRLAQSLAPDRYAIEAKPCSRQRNTDANYPFIRRVEEPSRLDRTRDFGTPRALRGRRVRGKQRRKQRRKYEPIRPRNSRNDAPENLDNYSKNEPKASLSSAPKCPHETAPGCSSVQLLPVAVPVFGRDILCVALESNFLSPAMGIDFDKDHSK